MLSPPTCAFNRVTKTTTSTYSGHCSHGWQEKSQPFRCPESPHRTPTRTETGGAPRSAGAGSSNPASYPAGVVPDTPGSSPHRAYGGSNQVQGPAAAHVFPSTSEVREDLPV